MKLSPLLMRKAKSLTHILSANKANFLLIRLARERFETFSLILLISRKKTKTKGNGLRGCKTRTLKIEFVELLLSSVGQNKHTSCSSCRYIFCCEKTRRIFYKFSSSETAKFISYWMSEQNAGSSKKRLTWR